MICRELIEGTACSRPSRNAPPFEAKAENNVVRVNRSAKAVLSAREKVREPNFYNRFAEQTICVAIIDSGKETILG